MNHFTPIHFNVTQVLLHNKLWYSPMSEHVTNYRKQKKVVGFKVTDYEHKLFTVCWGFYTFSGYVDLFLIFICYLVVIMLLETMR